MIWLVAYNYPMAAWSSGGNLDEYDRAHWDLYEVHAKYRDEAEAQAKALRRQHRSLPQRQLELLAELVRRASGNTDAKLEADGLHAPTLLRLESKGLIQLMDDGSRVSLRLAALNRGLSNGPVRSQAG